MSMSPSSPHVLFAEQYYVNAGIDDSRKRIFPGRHPPKVFGARRNPVRVTRLGLGAGVIFFCRATPAMTMNLSDTFRRHAEECRRMATSGAVSSGQGDVEPDGQAVLSVCRTLRKSTSSTR